MPHRSITTRPWSAAGLLAVIALVWATSACRRQPAAEPDPNAHVVRVSPSKLFVGELKRIEPHLGLTASGCVRIDAPDREIFFGIEMELWQAGQPVRGLGYGRTRMRRPEEVSFSLREELDATGKRKYRRIEAVLAKEGGFSGNTTIDAPERDEIINQHCYSVLLPEARTITEGEWVPVWAYVVSPPTGGRHVGLPFDEAIKTAKWALVAKVRWDHQITDP